jgi:hypothetical protein
MSSVKLDMAKAEALASELRDYVQSAVDPTKSARFCCASIWDKVEGKERVYVTVYNKKHPSGTTKWKGKFQVMAKCAVVLATGELVSAKTLHQPGDVPLPDEEIRLGMKRLWTKHYALHYSVPEPSREVGPPTDRAEDADSDFKAAWREVFGD